MNVQVAKGICCPRNLIKDLVMMTMSLGIDTDCALYVVVDYLVLLENQ